MNIDLNHSLAKESDEMDIDSQSEVGFRPSNFHFFKSELMNALEENLSNLEENLCKCNEPMIEEEPSDYTFFKNELGAALDDQLSDYERYLQEIESQMSAEETKEASLHSKSQMSLKKEPSSYTFLKSELETALNDQLDAKMQKDSEPSDYTFFKNQLQTALDYKIVKDEDDLIKASSHYKFLKKDLEAAVDDGILKSEIKQRQRLSDYNYFKDELLAALKDPLLRADFCSCYPSYAMLVNRRLKDIPKDHCQYFNRTEEYAKLLVDDILKTAVDILHYQKKLEPTDVCFCNSFHLFSGDANDWCTIENFNIEFGSKKIKDFFTTFAFKDNWLVFVTFVAAQSDAVSDFYLYEAICSLPTKVYPIPQVTASVYFTVEVSRVIPKTCPVNITYTLEGSGTVFNTCSDAFFTENMLIGILYTKINFIKKITF